MWDTKPRLRQQNSHSIRETRISTRCECKRPSPNTREAVRTRSHDALSEAVFYQGRCANRANRVIIYYRACRRMESIVRVPRLSHRRQLWKLHPQLTIASWFKQWPQRISDRKRIPKSRSVIWRPHFSIIQHGRSQRRLPCACLAALRPYLAPTSRDGKHRSALLYQPWSPPCYCLNYSKPEFVPPFQRIRGTLSSHLSQLSWLCWHTSTIISSCMSVAPRPNLIFFKKREATFLTNHGLTWKNRKNLDTGTGSEGSNINPTNVFPPPTYQPLATAPFTSHQHQLQYVWVPFLVPILSGVPPPSQSCLHGIPIAPSSAAKQIIKWWFARDIFFVQGLVLRKAAYMCKFWTFSWSYLETRNTLSVTVWYPHSFSSFLFVISITIDSHLGAKAIQRWVKWTWVCLIPAYLHLDLYPHLIFLFSFFPFFFLFWKERKDVQHPVLYNYIDLGRW